MDIILSSLAIIFLLPVFLIIILTLLISGEKNVFYKQKRVGYGRQDFNMIKFTTMIKDSLKIGTGSITLRNDPRVTPVGKILRMTKLNELPQLFNVLIGEMSLVGPRPLVDKTFNAYTPEVQEIISKLKPGITGIGSIVFRDEEKILSLQKGDPYLYYSDFIAPVKGAMEVWYYSNKSIWMDLKLIFLTCLSVFLPNFNMHWYFFKNLPMKDKLKEIYIK